MTKRIICVTFIVLMLMAFYGCGNNNETFSEPVLFYYPELPQDNGAISHVISPEQREGKGISNDLSAFLQIYLTGPQSNALYSPFPKDIELLSAVVEDQSVILTFTSSFGDLSGLERSIACASISMTCMELTGAESVEIFAENTLFDGEESITMTRDNLLFEDNTPISQSDS